MFYYITNKIKFIEYGPRPPLKFSSHSVEMESMEMFYHCMPVTYQCLSTVGSVSSCRLCGRIFLVMFARMEMTKQTVQLSEPIRSYK